LKWFGTLARLIDGGLDAWNRYKAKKSASNPAESIANNDDGVLKSSESFKDLADKSKRNIPE
tara:strand:- start:88 stop:273 length:186 start_codon:yes stop_codon:yes gene_type:complete